MRGRIPEMIDPRYPEKMWLSTGKNCRAAKRATGTGVEREFIQSGRIITKHRNRLSLHTIRDLIQYKWVVARHEGIAQGEAVQDRPIKIDSASTSVRHKHHAEHKDLSRWQKNWEAKETLGTRIERLAESVA